MGWGLRTLDLKLSNPEEYVTDWQIRKVKPDDVAHLKASHLRTLVAPMDGMWESFVGMGQHFCVERDSEPVCSFVIDAEKRLLQFYSSDSRIRRPVFKQIVDSRLADGAVVSTGDPVFLSLCMDHLHSVEVNALAYSMDESTGRIAMAIVDDPSFRVAQETEFATFVDFGISSIEADRIWLEGYYTERIQRQELWGQWDGAKLIAAGECRISDSQPPYADLGMVVSRDNRGRGLATDILKRLIGHSLKSGLRPICSTERDNVAAQKAIEKSGLIASHRILAVKFGTSS